MYIGVTRFKCLQSTKNYIPSRPSDYDFPCLEFDCNENNRICSKHKKIMLVKRVKKIKREIDYSDNTQYVISFGNWESWAWYKHAISEATGIPVSDQRLIYAGKMIKEKDDHTRNHSIQ